MNKRILEQVEIGYEDYFIFLNLHLTSMLYNYESVFPSKEKLQKIRTETAHHLNPITAYFEG